MQVGILILMMVLGSVSLYAQTNRSGNPVNPTQPDPNKPNTAVTPNANVPVIPQSQTIQPGNSQATTNVCSCALPRVASMR